jgi:hypothetical protein
VQSVQSPQGQVGDCKVQDLTAVIFNPPFTVPHLFAQFAITGPLITKFPITTCAMLDIGCPSTVISSELVEHLELRQHPLPQEEDNLSSLSDSPLQCLEYVKLELSSGGGQWDSRVICAKVNTGLPVPLILGMPFLSSKHIVIDVHKCTAIDKRSGYDLINPTSSCLSTNTSMDYATSHTK